MEQPQDHGALADDENEPRRALTRDIMLLSRRWRVLLDQSLKASGQTQARWRTLNTLEGLGEQVTQRDLAAAMGIEEPGLVRLLDSLEQADLVKRRVSEHDRRANAIEIRPAGRVALEAGNRAAAELLDQLFAGADEDDIRIASRLMRGVLERLDAQKAAH
ncbi:MAG TPA: MarR family transcriptional regulator [Phenylobacterium sp.]